MATFDELLEQLKSKAVRVFLLDKHYEVNKRDYYQFIRYYWLDENNVLKSESVIIHVLVKEDNTEEAYWKGKIPSILIQTPSSTLQDKVEQYAKNNISNFVGLNPVTVDEIKGRGVFEVYIYDESSDSIVKKMVFVWKDQQGKIKCKEIKQ